MLIAVDEYRFANSSFAAKSHQKAKARSHTQKPLESSAWSLLNVSNTSATEWLSSVVKLKLQRMLRYVLLLLRLEPSVFTNAILQNEYASILAKRVNEEKNKRTELRKRRASSMRR